LEEVPCRHRYAMPASPTYNPVDYTDVRTTRTGTNWVTVRPHPWPERRLAIALRVSVLSEPCDLQGAFDTQEDGENCQRRACHPENERVCSCSARRALHASGEG
jgi:hypothetical protein